MAIVFYAMSIHVIIVEGVKPGLNVSPSDWEGYQSLPTHALLILIQVISKPILEKVAKYRSLHASGSIFRKATIGTLHSHLFLKLLVFVSSVQRLREAPCTFSME